MLILTLVQSIIAMAFLLVGLVALFGIGITGLLFLVPGAVFAATAGAIQEQSRAATAVALGLDAVLGYLAVRKLEALSALQASDSRLGHTVGTWDYLPPSAALVLVGIGALGVLWDWRAVQEAPWI